jgi:hypothetical protein
MDGRHARAVLGVAEHASADDIRGAFRRRALSTHPDRGGDRTAFELVVLAFETLQHVDVTSARREITTRNVVLFDTAPPVRPRFSAHDCARRAAPKRQFSDALRVAMARQ